MGAFKEYSYLHFVEDPAPPAAEGDEPPPEPKNSIKEETTRFADELTKLSDNLVKYNKFCQKVVVK